jgi:hypothetical protein
MNRRGLIMAVPVLAVSAILAGATLVQDGLKSGLPVGEGAPPFDVLDVTGPNAGNELCYR